MSETDMIGNRSSSIEGPSPYGQELSIPDLGACGQKMVDTLTSEVIGQERAARGLAKALSAYNAGLRLDAHLPICCMLFVGPTGTGKTMMAKAFARYLIDPTAKTPPLIRTDGESVISEHGLSTLIGSDRGLIGSTDVPALGQGRLDQPHFWAKLRLHMAELRVYERAKACKNVDQLNRLVAELAAAMRPLHSVWLLDELEKSNSAFWNLLLHVLGDGEISMKGSDDTVTSFSNTFIIATGNVGSVEQRDYSTKKPVGFSTITNRDLQDLDKKTDQEIYEIVKRHARLTFRPEFMDRIGKNIIVFRALTRGEVRVALQNRYRDFQKLLDGRPQGAPKVVYTEAMTEYLVDRGRDPERGMRLLNEVFRKSVIDPITVLLEGDAAITDKTTLTFDAVGKYQEELDTRGRVVKQEDKRVVRVYRS